MEYTAVLINLTPEQKRKAQAMAGAAGLSLTAFVRETIDEKWSAYVRQVNSNYPQETESVDFPAGNYD